MAGIFRSGRLHWLDNLRIALTAVVIVHHAVISFVPGQWWWVHSGTTESRLLPVLRFLISMLLLRIKAVRQVL
jgi:hypothetical protein